jgi:hypothetical protein
VEVTDPAGRAAPTLEDLERTSSSADREPQILSVEALDEYQDVIGRAAPPPPPSASGEGEPVMPAPEPPPPLFVPRQPQPAAKITDPFLPAWTTPPPEPAALQPAQAASTLLGTLLGEEQAGSPLAGIIEDLPSDAIFELAFERVEAEPPSVPPDASLWQLQRPPPIPPPARAAPSDDDDLPVVVGGGAVDDDLPVVVGSAPTRTTTPLWIVGEPAKKG